MGLGSGLTPASGCTANTWRGRGYPGWGAAREVSTTQTLETGVGGLLEFAKASAKRLQRYVTFLLAPVSAHREEIKYRLLSSDFLTFSFLANQ